MLSELEELDTNQGTKIFEFLKKNNSDNYCIHKKIISYIFQLSGCSPFDNQSETLCQQAADIYLDLILKNLDFFQHKINNEITLDMAKKIILEIISKIKQ